MALETRILLFILLQVFFPGLRAGADEFICPADGIFANPENCRTFYLCTGLKPQLMPCPQGTLFDPKTNTCNTADLVTCSTGPQTTSSATPSTSTSTTTTTTTPSTSKPTTTSKPQNTPSPTPNCPPTGVHKIPDPKNCTIFYVCIEGHSAVEVCPPNYGFNRIEERCTISDNDCQPGGSVKTTPSPDLPKCPSGGDGKVPNPENCNTFYLCRNGLETLITCPVDYQYNEEEKTCVMAASSVCGDFVTPKPENEICKGKPDGTLLPDPTDCAKFYSCNANGAVSNKCPPGLEFNKDKNYCDQPEAANCHV